MKIRKIIPILTIFIMVLSLNINVNAKPELSAWTNTSPSIDGIASTGEWDSADQGSFTILEMPATIYVMNDQDNLYILVKIGPDNDTDPHDTCGIYFDNDNSGGIILADGDDALMISIEGFQDLYWNATLLWDNLVSDGVQNQNGAGAGDQDTSKTWYFEFSHPLNSSDNSHDFSLSIGDFVGFAISFADWNGSNLDIDFWPADWNVPDGYDQIMIANEPQPFLLFGIDPIVFFTLIAVAAISIGGVAFYYWRSIQKTALYCPDCGAKLTRGSSFCQRCGRRIEPIKT
jgi:hypothetical protein